MSNQSTKLWKKGPSVPLITPFRSDDSIDHEALAKQVVRLVNAKVGIVLLGTNGEASHLSREERRAVVATGRKALNDAGFPNEPLLIGTGGGSLVTTLEFSKDASAEGATHSIVICPGYFAFAMVRDRRAIIEFFTRVMDQSPIPVMIYNFPGAAAGIDLDSDELIELSEHKNCFGVKLTCAMIGKGHRLAAHVQSKEYLRAHGSRLQAISEAGFQVLSGFAESLLPALISRHTGCITGTGNVFPKTVRRLYDQAVSGLKGDDVALTEAIALQDRIARSEFVLTKASIQGTKYAMDHFVEKGAGGVARPPLGVLTDALREMVENDLKEDWEFESTL